ncbi:MAG: CHAD domain-containing protein [Coriobacteriia bacterium]|nr:CHAD domain-containing protein [Coriobacteriia bacterium]
MEAKFALAGVTARTPLAEAAPAMLRAKAEPLFELEAAARGGADADAVHDMRVASRRLREVMRLLAPLYPSRDFRRWYRRARSITRALGPVRDSDVFIEEFGALGRRLGEGGKRAVTFMLGYRMGQREAELEALNDALSRLDLAERRASFTKMAGSIAESSDAGRSLAEFAHAAVAERATVVFDAQPAALAEADIEAQHALRIDYKRLRYAVEAFAPCYGDEFGQLHGTLTAFQDTLGELHDLHVFADMVRSPERVEAALRAGVSENDLAEVAALLDALARERFAAFTALVSEHPAASLFTMLLRPLEPPRSAAPGSADDVAMYEELPIASPVIVGDEPWAVSWDGTGEILGSESAAVWDREGASDPDR